MTPLISTTEIFSLVNIVNREFKSNILSIGRRRANVYGRMVAYRILRDIGYSLKQIGRAFGKDHATIINALNKFEDYSTYDFDLVDTYKSISREFFVVAGVDKKINETKDKQQQEIDELNERVNELSLQVTKAEQNLVRYKEIIDLFEERNLSSNDIKYFTRRINQMLNGVHNFVE